MIVCRIKRAWIRDEERKIEEKRDMLIAKCQVMNNDEKIIREIDGINTMYITLNRMYEWKTTVHKKSRQ